jgi:hypothetical protein
VKEFGEICTVQCSGSGIFSLTWCKQQYSEPFLNGFEAKPRKVPVMKVVEEYRGYNVALTDFEVQ